MAILWILINVMCTVNIRGHEANFCEADARCHEAEIEAGARKWGRDWSRMTWPRGHMGLEALTSLVLGRIACIAWTRLIIATNVARFVVRLLGTAQKRLNQSRYHLVKDSCGPVETRIRWECMLVGATWRIRVNDSCAPALRQTLWPFAVRSRKRCSRQGCCVWNRMSSTYFDMQYVGKRKRGVYWLIGPWKWMKFISSQYASRRLWN